MGKEVVWPLFFIDIRDRTNLHSNKMAATIFVTAIFSPVLIIYRFSLNFYRKIFADMIFIPTFASELSIIVKKATLKTNLKLTKLLIN